MSPPAAGEWLFPRPPTVSMTRCVTYNVTSELARPAPALLSCQPQWLTPTHAQTHTNAAASSLGDIVQRACGHGTSGEKVCMQLPLIPLITSPPTPPPTPTPVQFSIPFHSLPWAGSTRSPGPGNYWGRQTYFDPHRGTTHAPTRRLFLAQCHCTARNSSRVWVGRCSACLCCGQVWVLPSVI